jgi:hypothetical protein
MREQAMAAIDVDGIAAQILAQAKNAAGGTWTKIKKATPLYARGYAQALADIAQGVADGEISKKDAKMYAQNAELILVMSIANTSQIVLHEVQKLIDGVLGVLKSAINAKLPVPLL